MRLAPIILGQVTIDMPVILAPMTGVTDLPFRRIVRRYGSGLNVTEMIASQAMIRETRQSLQKAASIVVSRPSRWALSISCFTKSGRERALPASDFASRALLLF